MGDPKKIRKKYDTPRHPWIKSKIIEERRIRKEFGTRNKKEIWKMETVLKNFKAQAKNLLVLKTNQADIETKNLFRKVKQLGLTNEEITFDTILGLKLDDIMARRLQTVVCKRGLAKTPLQARQFIVHEHILVNGKKITAPSYIVSSKEESSIEFASKSPLSDSNHPERVVKGENLADKKEVEKESKKKNSKSTKKPVDKDLPEELIEELKEIKELEAEEIVDIVEPVKKKGDKK